MNEVERIEALERQVADLVERLARSQALAEQALANTDRAIAQTQSALDLAQAFRKSYEDLLAARAQ